MYRVRVSMLFFKRKKNANNQDKGNAEADKRNTYKIYKEGEMLDNPLEGPKQFDRSALDFDRDFDDSDFDIN